VNFPSTPSLSLGDQQRLLSSSLNCYIGFGGREERFKEKRLIIIAVTASFMWVCLMTFILVMWKV
jgi:hypothetical protein